MSTLRMLIRAQATTRSLLAPHMLVAPRVRPISCSPILLHGSFERAAPKSPEDIVNINVIDRKAKKHALQGKVGDNLLYLMHKFQEDDPDMLLEGTHVRTHARTYV